MARITTGSILESKFTYGWEITSFDFYEVVSISDKGVATLRPLQKQKTYFPGEDGNIYYDTPCEVVPTMHTRLAYDYKTGRDVPKNNIRRKIYNFGTDREYVVPEKYYIAKVWSGTPKAVWNLH